MFRIFVKMKYISEFSNQNIFQNSKFPGIMNFFENFKFTKKGRMKNKLERKKEKRNRKEKDIETEKSF